MPLDMRNDIRAMDADGVARAEIARRLHVSRNTGSCALDGSDREGAIHVIDEVPREMPFAGARKLRVGSDESARCSVELANQRFGGLDAFALRCCAGS